MKSTRVFLTAAAAALGVLSLFLPTRVHAVPPQYRVIDLGTLLSPNPYANSYAYGINASGQVAGISNYFTADTLYYHAVRWTGTTPTDLGTLGGTRSYGYGINASGQVAGAAYLAGDTGFQHAVRWTGTTPQDLGMIAADSAGSGGLAINVSGQIAGGSRIAGGASIAHAVRWTGTNLTDLGSPTGFGYGSEAWGINSSGQVAGDYETPNAGQGTYGSQAALWTGTTLKSLSGLGGHYSYGYGINDSGQVTGGATTANDAEEHAIRWTGTQKTDLGTLGGVSAFGTAINASGDVVGMSYTSDDVSLDAFLYTGGAMYALQSLLVPGSGVFSLTFVDDYFAHGNAINDLGQIAVTGFVAGGNSGAMHALRLDPVAAPEPASAALLLGGGALLGLRRRR